MPRLIIAVAVVVVILLSALLPRIMGREHAVVAYLKLSDRNEGTPHERAKIAALQQELARALRHAQAGEFREELVAGGWCLLSMGGPDADRLFAAVSPILQRFRARRGSFVVKRHGEYGAPAREFPL